ncbi:MAG: hypothetical protein JJ964_15270 [Rhizobiales bacterium]|nr:hypothetical protein [Hyphomicrobiales bacterium]
MFQRRNAGGIQPAHGWSMGWSREGRAISTILVSMKWSGFQGAGTPLGLSGEPWGVGELGGFLTGGAEAKRCE